MPDTRSLIVVGAGIGGLTAALALARAGMRVTVLERAAQLQEVGAGLQLSPNASRVLIDLGLETAIEERAFAPEGIRLFSALAGGEITRIPLGESARTRYGAPFWSIHRADLHTVLADACRAEPGIRLELDAELRGVDAAPGRVDARAGIAGTEARFEAEGLVGADGVHSVVRTRIMDGPVASFTGRIAYRAVIPIDETPESLRNVGGLWLAPNAHLVHYPVRAGRELNIVAITEGDWRDEAWSAPALREDVLRQFSGVTGTQWPELARALVAAPSTWTKWALRGLDAGFQWTGGASTLLGDAAHAMLPFAAQGACMAIEDAAVLARELAVGDDIATAMRRYEQQRKARVISVTRLAAANGRYYHMGAALGRIRDAGLSLLGGERILARQDWVYRWRG